MLHTINNLITIRNFLYIAVNDDMIKMTPEKTKSTVDRLALLNNKILNLTLAVDLDKEIEASESRTVTTTINATAAEPETIEELDKIDAEVKKASKPVRDHKIKAV